MKPFFQIHVLELGTYFLEATFFNAHEMLYLTLYKVIKLQVCVVDKGLFAHLSFVPLVISRYWEWV